MPVSVTVQNSAGEVLFGPEDVDDACSLTDLAGKLAAAPEGHSWSLFQGSVKVSQESTVGSLAEDGKILLNASYSTVAEKATPLSSAS
mmetsp:Transcript_45095/g.104298  ORF Transcript_45095/g.104298 Transcript_45095/m.104298 type:complete len:88 (-) Transcript_45095:86-349(-)